MKISRLLKNILEYSTITIMLIIIYYSIKIKITKEGFIYKGEKLLDNDFSRMKIEPINEKNRMNDITKIKFLRKLKNSKVINILKSEGYIDNNLILNKVSQKEAEYYIKNGKFEYSKELLDKMEKILKNEVLLHVKKTMTLQWLNEKKEQRLEKLKNTNLKKYNREINKQALKGSRFNYDTITMKLYNKTIKESNEKLAKKIGRGKDEKYIEEQIKNQKKNINNFVKNVSDNIIKLVQQIPVRILIINKNSSMFFSIFGEDQHTHNFLKRILNIKNIQPLFINNSIIKCEEDNSGRSALMLYTINPVELLSKDSISLNNKYIQKRKIYNDEIPSIMEKADIEFKFIKEPCNICDTKNAEKCPYSINDKVSPLMSRFWGLKSSELANNNSIITFENNKEDLNMADPSLLENILRDDINNDVVLSTMFK